MRALFDAALRYITTLGIAVILLEGDQQKFSRMVWLRRFDGANKYSQIVPFVGDFHAAVHMLMAIHRLWWSALTKCLIEESGFQVESLKEKWGSAELYNRYCFSYEVLIVAVLSYMLEVLPRDLLDQPQNLAALAKDASPGFAVLFHFLYDFGLPWLEFRQAIRSNDSEKMDSMYALTLPWFIACGKTQYERICIDHTYLQMALNRSLAQVRAQRRTVSVLGNDGRNVAYDQANEFQN